MESYNSFHKYLEAHLQELFLFLSCSQIMASLALSNHICSEVYASKLSSEQNPPQIPDEITLSRGLNEKHYFSSFGRKVFTEFIATFFLVFVTCGTAAISANDQNAISKLGASLAGGLIVTVMIYAVGHISGAHMNPAVTLAFASALRFPWKQVPLYWAAQLTGATTASFLLRELLHPITNLGTTTPSNTALQALVMEIVVTFCMMFVTSAVATDNKAIGELAGIAVGSSVCITSILAGPVSGGSMNPARTIGPALASQRFDALWVYILGPVCGTLLGAWSYRLIRDTDQAIPSTGTSSLKLRRQQTHTDKLASEKDPMDDVC